MAAQTALSAESEVRLDEARTRAFLERVLRDKRMHGRLTAAREQAPCQQLSRLMQNDGASEGGKVSATYRDAGAGAHRSRALVKTIGAACAPRTSSPEAIKAQASLVSETSKSHKGIERSVRGVPRRT